MQQNNLDLIFEEWKAALKTKDRSAPAVEGNFDELFEALRQANATFDEAHAILPKAIKAHLPQPGLARAQYKNAKNHVKFAGQTEKEFIESWHEDIAGKGTNSFFNAFPRPKAKDEDDDGEPKVYGNMSVKEYKLQRRYAESFPILDTEELERRMLSGSYNPMEDIADILSKKKDNNG